MSKLSSEEIEKRRDQFFKNVDLGIELVRKMITTDRLTDPDEYQKLLKEYRNLHPDYCEHEKPRVENCMACDDIFKQCFPENCLKCNKCLELYLDADEIDQDDICFNCRANNK